MLNEILIALGAIILFYSLFLFISFRKKEKLEFGILSKKITFINNIFHLLILFFFIGYCLIISQICNDAQSDKLVFILAQVLFWGAIFVVITIVLLKIMLDNIVKAKLNQIDTLTSLYNKMSGNCKICEILVSHTTPIFLAILDLDNFKKVNDIYGHLIGDELLVKTAKIIKANIGKDDIACRFGGDEFVIVLLDKTEEESRRIFNKIRNNINNFSDNYKEAYMSISIGVSYGVGKGAGGSMECTTLMENADKALYHVKKNGKNSVHFYTEENAIYNK